ncbi:MAG: HD domain-containing protein [Actinobacteria bacterium]|nr:HD domain-containing protein [Actinomycetota bacterium]
MIDQQIRAFARSLRRASGYVRLYGFQHPLCTDAVEEAARAATELIGDRPGLLIGIVDDTLFIDGEPSGLISLQFNGFLREVLAAGIETLIMTPPVDPDELGQIARLIAGDIDAAPIGRSLRVNAVDLVRGPHDGSPAARLRRSYSHSLDALRSFGSSVESGSAASLDETASVVKNLLEQSLANPAAALLLTTVKSHHEYTFYHSVNTSILSLGLAGLVGISERDQVVLGIGAMLHDIGKIGVSRAVLQHPGRLDAAQWEEVRRHPQLGAEAILAAAAPGEELAAVVAFEHHARFDGSGYPRLVYHDGTHHHHGPGHPLHFYSRLVAVADTYDAITTRRSYRRAEPPSRALQVLVSEAGTSYDPDFVLAFASMMGIYPPGSFLRLASGEIVMVTRPSDDPTVLPTAVVVRDRAGSEVAAPEPVPYADDDIVEQVAASALGIQPAQVLERLPADC